MDAELLNCIDSTFKQWCIGKNFSWQIHCSSRNDAADDSSLIFFNLLDLVQWQGTFIYQYVDI
jgi:hypothetical protein